MKKLPQTFTEVYKIIYVYDIPELKSHAGYVKVGETTAISGASNEECALRRIKHQTATAGVTVRLLYTEAVKFNDHDVHAVLENEGIERADFGTGAREWFKTDAETVKKAIAAIKSGKLLISNHNNNNNNTTPIILRPEQEEAIQQTISRFMAGAHRMLWNAKMRFGKTVCALEVVRQGGFGRTLILTHVPSVNTEWKRNFEKVLAGTQTKYIGLDTNNREAVLMCADELLADKKIDSYIYFASLQDARGSASVGGKYDKNEAVFRIKWDFVIIDETHVGVRTELGQNVIDKIVSSETKMLCLSGTPYNCINDFASEDVFTWDYTMEQEAKRKFELEHPGDYNQYACMPRLNFCTYRMDPEIIKKYYKDCAFNFTEFFNVKNNKFTHEEDVTRFINTMFTPGTNYPFSTKEYRKMFRHTLWVVPGVKEAKALKALLETNNRFDDDENWKIINIAGSEQTDEIGKKLCKTQDYLEAVQNAIKKYTNTITITCGRLTTGATVPEWTAVFMLKDIESTAAYMQTIFRVQGSCSFQKKDGTLLQKDNCFVFDFDPDRTLSIIYNHVRNSNNHAGSLHDAMRDFINYAPVISNDGGVMEERSIDDIINRVNKHNIDIMRKNGGCSSCCIDIDAVLNINTEDKCYIKSLSKNSAAANAQSNIEVNSNGLDNKRAVYETSSNSVKNGEDAKDCKSNETENEAEIDNLKTALANFAAKFTWLAMSAYVNNGYKQYSSLVEFVDSIDGKCWDIMSPLVTKTYFKKHLFNYYNDMLLIYVNDTITRFENISAQKSAIVRCDMLMNEIDNWADDKDIVKTPRDIAEYMIGTVCQRYQGKQIADKKVINIGSKTGVFARRMAMEIMRHADNGNLSDDERNIMFNNIIKNQVFTLCSTEKEYIITSMIMNLACGDTYDNIILINMKDTNMTQTTADIIKKFGKFDIAIGNPPYQLTLKQTTGFYSAKTIFNKFQELADKIAARTCLIYPGGWVQRTRTGLKEFGLKQTNDNTLEKVIYWPDNKDVFPAVNIKDGITVVVKDNNKTEYGFELERREGNNVTSCMITEAPGDSILCMDPNSARIIEKTHNFVVSHNMRYVKEHLMGSAVFGLSSNIVALNLLPVTEYTGQALKDDELILHANDICGSAGRQHTYVVKTDDAVKLSDKKLFPYDLVQKYKVVVNKASPNGGASRNWRMQIHGPNEVSTRSQVIHIMFDTRNEAVNYVKWCHTQLIRFLFLQTGAAVRVCGEFTPSLNDYTDNNGIIDFNCGMEELSRRVYGLFGITEGERAYIEDFLKKNDKSKLLDGVIS